MNMRAMYIMMLTVTLIFSLPTFAAAPDEPGTADMKPISNWKSDWAFQNRTGVYAKREGALIRVGNAALERVFRVVNDNRLDRKSPLGPQQGSNGDAMGTFQLVNKRSGRKPDSQQWGEFSVALSGVVTGELSAPDFQLVDVLLKSGDDPTLIGFKLQGREQPGLKVEVFVQTAAEAAYQRKWLKVYWDGDGDIIVDHIDVESTAGLGWWYIGNPTHLGMGQPLFVADLFMGLEYPAGEVTGEYLAPFSRSVREGRPHEQVRGLGRGESSGLRASCVLHGLPGQDTSHRKTVCDLESD